MLGMVAVAEAVVCTVPRLVACRRTTEYGFGPSPLRQLVA